MQNRFAGVILLICASVIVASTGAANQAPASMSRCMLSLPLAFEPTETSAIFAARGSGFGMLLSSTHMSIGLRSGGQSRAFEAKPFRPAPNPKTEITPLDIQLLGANSSAVGRLEQRLTGHTSYMIGNDPSRWRTNVPLYSRAKYDEVYPGIDVTYYGSGRQLEYDFVVAPGADCSAIRFGFSKQAQLTVLPSGALKVCIGQHELELAVPLAYQAVDGFTRKVDARFEIADANTVTFRVGKYARNHPLIIDPILQYGTLLGGANDDEAHAVAVDSSGNIYVTGLTTGAFPVKSGFDMSANGNADCFIAKINPNLSGSAALIYSTYFGGSNVDEGNGIAVDASGNAYVSGDTNSANFPRSGFTGSPGDYEVFVAKLNSSGTAFSYVREFGGPSEDLCWSIAINSAGNAWVTGRTASIQYFPATTYQRYNRGYYDAFVTKLSTTGGISYSTYLGGTGNDEGLAITVDASGCPYVCGGTNSPDFFTTPDRFAPFSAGGADAFITKFNSSASSLSYSTYLGGASDDEAMAIALDSAGGICVAGYTSSINFPVLNAFQYLNAGAADVFATKFKSDQSGLAFSTYLGGSDNEAATAIAVDSNRNLYLTGRTDSANFPLQSPVQWGYDGMGDAFVTKLNSAGTAPIFSTFLGSGSTDAAYGIALGQGGKVYVAGFTSSPEGLTTSNGYQTSYGGGMTDAFVTQLAPATTLVRDDKFPTNVVMPAGSPTGWVPVGMTDQSIVGYDYDAANQALRVRVTSVATDATGHAVRYRMPALVNGISEWMPYSSVGTQNNVRMKYYIYATGQANPSQLNQIPNFRVRGAIGFCQTSYLEVNHHMNDLPGDLKYARELRPSTDPTKPSLYRMDFRPADVPYLQQKASDHWVMRGFEAQSYDPQDNGYICLAESTIGTYPASLLSDNVAPVKVYAPDVNGAGDLARFHNWDVDCYNLYFPPGSLQGSFGTRENTNVPLYSESSLGVTIDSSTVPSSRVGIVSCYFNPDRATNQYATHARVSEGKEWKIRFHLTSTQLTTKQPYFVLRARTIGFAWSQTFEFGGANAPDVNVSRQLLPGIGNQTGGWYTIIMQSPLSSDIRSEYPAEYPIWGRMPNIWSQPGFGVPQTSLRDILMSFDMIDTMDEGPGATAQQAQVTIDRIEVREYGMVDD